MEYLFAALIGYIIGYTHAHHVMLKDWTADVNDRYKNFYKILKDRKNYKTYLGNYKAIVENLK